MIDFGTVRPGTTLRVPFATYDSNDPSASITLTGLETTDIEIYKDGSVTQRASDNGYALLDTDGIDFDSITGIHGFSIDLADNSTAGFYASGSQYTVVVSSVTVDGATINFIAATFRIGYPDAIINTTIASLSSQTSFTLTAGPAEDDALNGCVVCIHDVASAVQLGYAVVLDYTGSTKTVTLAAGTTFTAAATDNIAIFPPANVGYWASGAVASPHTAGYPVVTVKDGTGTGEIDTSSGKVSITDGAISTATFAAGAINAAAIAADAIGASELAADAVTEIAAPILAVLGALNDAAADGAVTTTDTMVAYLKQIINTLEGAPGIPTWPASAAPGNAVSIAEAVRYIYDQIGVAGAGLTAADDAVITAISGLDTKLDTIDNFIDTEIATLITMLTGIVPVNGTIGATGNDTTHLHLSGIAWGNDGPNSMLLTIKDVSTGLFYSRWIEDFVDASDLATVATLPFTPEASVDLYWLTPVRADVTGGSGLDAAGVRAAVGLASANLDTQLDALPTAAENADAVWDEATTGHITSGTFGEQLKTDVDAILVDTGTTLDGKIDAIDGNVDSILADTGTDGVIVASIANNAITASAIAANAIGSSEIADGAITAAKIATDAIDADALAADAIAEINATVDTALADYDAPTKAELDAGLAAADDAVLAAIAALNNLSQANIRSAIGMASANLDTQLAAIDDAVDTEIAAIITAIDALPTNAELATALASADDAVLSAIAALVIPTAAQNADALLGRNIAGGSSTGRTVTEALRALRNRVKNNGDGTATVYAEDDTTPSWTAAITTDGSAEPITEVNPS